MTSLRPGLCLVLVGVCTVWTASVQAEEPAATVDYLRDVKPLLARYCTECHSEKAQKSGLRVDTAAALIAGGDTGAAVEPGKSTESLLFQAVTGAEGVARMPPQDPRLKPEEIALLKAWIDQGAKAPADEVATAAARKQSTHWAFQPIGRPEPPVVMHVDRVRNPIDAFVLKRLEAEGIEPAPEADRATLIRRLSLDLTGLLPTPGEVDAFVNDAGPNAYEALVDRLLASPHYGERWGRVWLDSARYADSNGFTRDMGRTIWKYRDWVIGALNRDLPFDQFTIEQIAGDMLATPTLDQQVATGFHRNTLINEEGGTDPEQFRVEAVVDRVNTTGLVFLGLTLGCAQCHDHKYDPVSQREYYQFYAFLNNAVFDPADPYAPKMEVPDAAQIAAGAPERKQEIRQQIATLESQFKEFQGELDEDRVAWEKLLSDDDKKKLPFNVLNAVNLVARDRTGQHKTDLDQYYKALELVREKFPILDDIAALRASEPKFAPTMVMLEQSEPRETHIHVRGDFLRHGARVQPAVPEVLPGLTATEKPSRLDLARWLVDPVNPLTSRVTMNRVWQRYFGRGIVETENDFGTQGTPPTHPELLDWLAREFMNRGWSFKAMHKVIVMSGTYRQSSQHRPELDELDPQNKLLARMPRLRLDAELIRDSALAASGLLAPKLGGPSVYPPQPDGVFDFTQDKKPWETAKGEDRFRRGMYTYLWRSSPYPAMSVFDFPDANIACTRRSRSNTPLQSLTLANDLTFVEFAKGLAARVLRDPAIADSERLGLAFRLCLVRQPGPAEAARLAELLDTQRKAFATDAAAARDFAPPELPAEMPAAEGAAWTAVARVLLNLDEFITRE